MAARQLAVQQRLSQLGAHAAAAAHVEGRAQPLHRRHRLRRRGEGHPLGGERRRRWRRRRRRAAGGGRGGGKGVAVAGALVVGARVGAGGGAPCWRAEISRGSRREAAELEGELEAQLRRQLR